MNDWRLTNQEKFLKGVVLKWTKFDEKKDHDHCEFCTDKFMGENYPEFLHYGYCTEDEYYWICKQCFDDFKDLFKWRVV